MTDVVKIAASLSEAEEVGPHVDAYHNRELPEHQWSTCRGCPSLRVWDWHYYYCRHLGDQTKPDAWNAGWRRLGVVTWNETKPVPCGLAVRDLLQAEREGG